MGTGNEQICTFSNLLYTSHYATKDVQTFVFDNLGQFGNLEEVQQAVNMLANALNQLVVSSTVRQSDRQLRDSAVLQCSPATAGMERQEQGQE
eukprot:1183399-Prorocentrum_minimum.AAC.1